MRDFLSKQILINFDLSFLIKIDYLSSELDLGGNIGKSLSHASLNHVVHGWVLGADKALEHVTWCIKRVAEGLLEEVGGLSTHAFDETLRGGEIPVHKTLRWVKIAIDCTEGKVANFVSSAADSDNFVLSKRSNDLFHRFTEVIDRGSNLNWMILCRFSYIERFKILDAALKILGHRGILGCSDFEDTVLS